MSKQFMTKSEAEIFMGLNNQFFYEFTSCKTELGEEPAYVYVDNGVKYLVIRDENNHPSIYAFESWSNGNEFQTSALYEGQEALDFITRHEESGTFATLHTFNDKDDAIAEYKKYYIN